MRSSPSLRLCLCCIEPLGEVQKRAAYGVGCEGVAVGIRIAPYPRTDPDGRVSRIRLLPQVVTRRRREG